MATNIGWSGPKGLPAKVVRWHCSTCWVSYPIIAMDKIRAHLKTKAHQKYTRACPHCRSLRFRKIAHECWDRDGIREAYKCARCLTEYKCYASGIEEKSVDEYTGAVPRRLTRRRRVRA